MDVSGWLLEANILVRWTRGWVCKAVWGNWQLCRSPLWLRVALASRTKGKRK